MMNSITISAEKLLIYLLMTILFCGIAHRLIGRAVVILLCILLIAFVNKLKLNIRVVMAVLFFWAFMGIKLLGGASFNGISEYVSLRTEIMNLLQFSILLILIFSMDTSLIDRGVMSYSLVLYNISIFVSSLVMLQNRSISMYRDGYETFIMAPQIFVNYALFFNILFFYLIIRYEEDRKRNILFLLNGLLYMVLSKYTTQILFMLLGMIFSWITVKNEKKRKKSICYSTFNINGFVPLGWYFKVIVVDCIKNTKHNGRDEFEAERNL